MPTVKELQQLLREKGLKISGRKDELIARLAGVVLQKSLIDKCSGKKCQDNKVCNPETGRCVNATGKIGKKMAAKVLSPPKKVLSEKNIKKLVIMEKAYEKSNQIVPTIAKLSKILAKWKKDVISPDLKKKILDFAEDDNEKIYMFKSIVQKAFPNKKIKDTDLAFIIIFSSSIKRALGKELFDTIEYSISRTQT